MSKFTLLLLTVCAALAMGMKGGTELRKRFNYFVYFLTIEDYFNSTTKSPHPKWLYCMGVLYDAFLVVTAELCRVEADGSYWAAGAGTELGQIHYIKSVIPGRHPLDFRVVEVKNSSVEKWGPLGKTDPLLMITLNEFQLKKIAEQETKGIVASFGKPPKIGAMMMLSLDECERRYIRLLKKFPNTTSILALELPRSVFCAVAANKAFEPKELSKLRFREAGPQNGTQPAPNGTQPASNGTQSGERPSGANADDAQLSDNNEHIPPGTACPDSLGSPFITSGGGVLGILVVADCRTENMAFFQSLVDGLPSPPDDPNVDEYVNTRTYWPSPPKPFTRVWTPRGPMVKGVTLRPAGWQDGAGIKPFGVASRFVPSMFLMSIVLTCVLWMTEN